MDQRWDVDKQYSVGLVLMSVQMRRGERNNSMYPSGQTKRRNYNVSSFHVHNVVVLQRL